MKYLKIQVSSYKTPISYKGKYYIRSGTNNHEAVGAELDKLIISKYGLKWEDTPMHQATLDDISQEAIDHFKYRAVAFGRMTQEQVNISNELLLKNLQLIDKNGNLKIAGLLLFGRNPEDWILGSYFKVGFFDKNDIDLRYQDEVHGPLIMQIDKITDLVYTKYLKGLIHYNGIHREEEYIITQKSFRELILNAAMNKQYETRNTIQIKIYDDEIRIFNNGSFPSEIDTNDIYKPHTSRPYNILIATTFFLAGYIESWGRGFQIIKEECKEHGAPLPIIETYGDGVTVICKPSKTYLKLLKDINENAINENSDTTQEIAKTTQETTQEVAKTTQETTQEVAKTTQEKIIKLIIENPDITQSEIANKLNLSRDGIKYNIKILKDNGIIERIGSTKSGYWKVNKK